MEIPKQYTYITYYDPNFDDNLDSGFITCIIGYPLKSWERRKRGGGDNLRSHR